MADEPDEPFSPSVQMLPALEKKMNAEIAKDPELGKAISAFKENALNAMQALHDGRYASFEDAMEAISGMRPEKAEPPNPPKHGYFAAIARDPRGDGYMAAITDGNPHVPEHAPVQLMDVKRFPTEAAAQEWAEQTAMELPWREPDDEPLVELPVLLKD